MVIINLKEETTIEFDMVIEGNVSKLENIGLYIREDSYEIKLPCEFQNKKVICSIPILEKIVSPGEKSVVLEVIVDNKIYRPFEQNITFEKPLSIQSNISAIHESITTPELSFKEVKLKKNITKNHNTLESPTRTTLNNENEIPLIFTEEMKTTTPIRVESRSKSYALLNETIEHNRKMIKKLEDNQISKKDAILEMYRVISNKFGEDSRIMKIWKSSEKNNNFHKSKLAEERAQTILKKLDLILTKIQEKQKNR
jgi:hypothetical protein